MKLYTLSFWWKEGTKETKESSHQFIHGFAKPHDKMMKKLQTISI